MPKLDGTGNRGAESTYFCKALCTRFLQIKIHYVKCTSTECYSGLSPTFGTTNASLLRLTRLNLIVSCGD